MLDGCSYYHLLSESTTILSATLCEQFGERAAGGPAAGRLCLDRRCCSCSTPADPGLGLGAGHCDQYANRSSLRIIDVRPTQFVCHANERYPPYFHEALACFSGQPLLHLNSSTLRDSLVHVETAWMGLGPRCRGSVSGCYQAGGPRLPPTPGLMAAWRATLGQCFGFDHAAAAPLRPVRLLVVDRLYESGRWGQRRLARWLDQLLVCTALPGVQCSLVSDY